MRVTTARTGILAVVLLLVTGLASYAAAGEPMNSRAAAQDHLDRGKRHITQEEWDHAIAEYEEARRLGPDDAWTEYLLAYSYASKAYRDGAWPLLDPAIAGFLRALALNPEFPEALNELGTAYSLQGQYAQAIDVYRRAIELRPEWTVPRYNKADAHRARSQWDQALAEYRWILEHPGSYARSLHRVHAAMGQVYETAGRLDEAASAYRRALALKPDFPEAHVGLANVYFLRGRLEEAITEYGEAVALQPANAELDYLISQLHALRGADGLALESLTGVIRKGWTNREAIKYNPLFRRLRTNPRFLDLVESTP